MDVSSVIKKLGHSLTLVPLGIKTSLMIKATLILYLKKPILKVEVKSLKQTSQFVILKACGLNQEQLVATLTVVLIQRDLTEECLNDLELINDVKNCLSISKEEVYEFSKLIGDQNFIHLTDYPVVQGLLLLDKVQEVIEDIRQIEMKFIKPVYADDPIYLIQGLNQMKGYSRQKLSIIATYRKSEG